MALRRHVFASIAAALGIFLGSPSPVAAHDAPRPSTTRAGDVVDAAVRTGRVDARVRNELVTAMKSDRSVRALIVSSPPHMVEGQSLESQRESVAPQKAEIAAIDGVRIENLLPSLNTTVVEIRSVEGLASLASLADATIVPDELVQRADSISEPYVGAPTVRSYGYDGLGTYIGIIDSGVDYTHADLGSCSYPGAPAPCRVALLPADFSHDSTGFLYDDGVLDDSIRHGTNVTATASAMAPGAKIIGADVFGPSGAYSSDIANAVQYMINLKAVGYPIVAVNLSLGYNSTTCLDSLGMGALRNAGIIPVVAAGNSAYSNGVFQPGMANPACVAVAVSVGATFGANFGSASFGVGTSRLCSHSFSAADIIACFSQASSTLSLLAPGAAIFAGGVQMSGTSQAAPHVAGALATIASAVPQATAANLIAGVTTSPIAIYDARIGMVFRRLSVPDALAATQALVGVDGPDSFDRAIALPAFSATVSTTAGYTAQTGETTHGRRTGISSTWFSWTAPASGRVTFSTSGSSFDTAMSVYRGSAINALSEVGWNDDSTIAGTAAVVGPLEVTGATSYRIAVSCGVAASSCGSISLSVSFSTDISRPSNDTHTNAIVVSGASGTVTATNAFALPQSGEPLQAGGAPAQKSIWFRIDSPGSTSLSLSTAGSTFDTSITVYEGVNPTSLKLEASHNDVGADGAKFNATSQVSVLTYRAPATYWIAVDSPAGSTGTVNLSWATTFAGAPQSPTAQAGPRVSVEAGATPAPTVGRRAAPQSNPPTVVLGP